MRTEGNTTLTNPFRFAGKGEMIPRKRKTRSMEPEKASALSESIREAFSLDDLPPPSLTEQLVFDGLFESAPLDRLSQRKNVELVHMIPRKGKLQLQLRKTWLVLHDYAIKQGLMEPGGRRRFRVLANQLFRDVDYDSNDYETIKNTLRNGLETVVSWGPSVKGKNGEQVEWEATTLLADIRFIKVKARLYIDWSYSDVLVSQLQQSGPWFRLSLNAVRKARSIGGLNLYMICERYRTNHGGLSDRMEPAVVHALLTGQPTPPPGTPLGREFKYWKRDTVDKWLAEVNSYGEPFRVAMKEHKIGRRVVALQFVVQEEQQHKPEAALSAVRQGYIERLVRCGVTEPRAKRFLKEHADRAISIALQHLEKARQNPNPKKPIRDAGAWFAGMVEKASTGEVQPLDVDQVEANGAQARAPQSGLPTLDEVLTNAKADFLASVDGAKAYFMSLAAEDRATVTEQFVEDMKPTPRWASQLRKAYESSGVTSPLVAASLWQWLLRVGFTYEPTGAELMQHAYNKGFVVPVKQ